MTLNEFTFFGTGSSGLIAREMKLRFMRLGVVCEALTDQDGFAWTTSIMDEKLFGTWLFPVWHHPIRPR